MLEMITSGKFKVRVGNELRTVEIKEPLPFSYQPYLSDRIREVLEMHYGPVEEIEVTLRPSREGP